MHTIKDLGEFAISERPKPYCPDFLRRQVEVGNFLPASAITPDSESPDPLDNLDRLAERELVNDGHFFAVVQDAEAAKNPPVESDDVAGGWLEREEPYVAVVAGATFRKRSVGPGEFPAATTTMREPYRVHGTSRNETQIPPEAMMC
jgi:hypothetical protein